jgi:hypothetical protein
MLAILLTLLLAPVSAERLAGQTLRTGCRQGECGWLRVRNVSTVRTVPEGRLRRLVGRPGGSTHPDGAIPRSAASAKIAWQGKDKVSYAFCSTRRPAFAFEDEDGKLIVHFLDLFDLGGYQYSSAGLYMRLCHGLAEVPQARRLRALGYRAGTRSGQLESADVDAITRF